MTLSRLLDLFKIYSCVVLFDAFNECFLSSVKGINRLISKEMSNINLKATVEEN